MPPASPPLPLSKHPLFLKACPLAADLQLRRSEEYMPDRLPPLPLPPVPDPAWAWFFDIDGTLIELAQEPSSLRAGRGFPDMLRGLMNRLDAMALVSGRSLGNMEKLVAPLALPMAGCHGTEMRLPDGSLSCPPAPPALARARRILAQLAERHPGLVLEEKPYSLALHFRHAPELAAACREAAREAAGSDLEWLAGKMIYEVKLGGFTKGTAIRRYMTMAPFAGRRPLFIGDDITDEDGFEAVAALGGIGILVGEKRPTKAIFRLENVSSVHAWLAGLDL